MLALKSKLGRGARGFGVASASTLMSSPARLEFFETVDVAPGVFAYRMAGDFSQAGQSVDAPLVVVARTSVLHIMKQQVTAADYDRCVAETECMARTPLDGSDPNLPAVQVSWQDASAYAAWLSAMTGETWRLPTDEEWVFAAGSRFHDDALSVAASRDPSVRWLARYEKESEQDALDQRPRPPGAFARMSMDCSIYQGTSGNGRTPALFDNRLMQRASPLAFRPPIVGCEPSKANTVPMFETREGVVALSASRRATWDSVWFERTRALRQWLPC